jgi:hypothetical protein
VPLAIDALPGLTDIDNKTGAVTAILADPVMVPEVAVIVVVPGVTLVAYPAAPIVATAETDVVQVADCVKSCVLPSVYVPTASNCCPVPSGIAAPLGVIVMETKVAPTTLIVLLAEMALTLAVMFAVPCPALVASP